MKQRNRRLVAMLCVLCMLFSSTPASVYADLTPATPTDLAPVEETVQEQHEEGEPEAAEPEETEEPEDEEEETEEDARPEADMEVTGSDDLTVEGSLEGNPPADYLIRFTPEKNQTLCMILTTDGDLKADVTDENTDTVKQFAFDHTDEQGQNVLTLPFYKVRQDSTFLIRLSGKEPADFSIRLVKMSILKEEEESAAAPETREEETIPGQAEEHMEEPAETPAEELTAEPAEEPKEEPAETPAEDEPVEVRIFAEDSEQEAWITFTSDAGIPLDAVLQVRELTEDEQAAYQARTVRALKCEDESYLYYTKYLELALLYNGETVALNAPVTVSVLLPDVYEGTDALQAVSFGKRTARLLECERTDNIVSFRTNTLTVFGIGNALTPLDTGETELASVEVLGFSADAEVSLKKAEAPEVEEGLEVLGSFTVEDRTGSAAGAEGQDGLWIKAELNGDAELSPMESVALYRVEDGAAEILVDDLSEDGEIMELDAQQVAVVRDTGYRHLTLTVNPEGTGEDQSVTLDGMMPKEAEVAVKDVTEDYTDTEQLTAEGEDENAAARTTLAAFDISISNGEEDYQPDQERPVSVEISDSRIFADEGIELWHILDDGTKEQVETFTVEDGKIMFEATGFSVYIVTGVLLRTYKFYTLDEYLDYVEYILYNEAGEDVVTQTIKSGEKPLAPQNPVNPQNPEATFAGWYLNKGTESAVLLDTEPYDFDNIPEITENEEVKLYAKFISSGYVIFHGQYDSSPDVQSFPVAYTRRTELVNGTGKVKISDLTVPYDGNGNDMVFAGWSSTSIREPGAALNDGGSPVSDVVTDSEGYYTIHGTVHLYPIFENVYWLSFYSGPTGSGATYYRETYYFNGSGPDSLADRIPTRKGYTFAGWYADAELDANGEVLTGAPAVMIADADGTLQHGASGTGISVSGGQIRLSSDATLYAAWTKDDTANYTIVIMRQKASDETGIPDAEKSYEYAEHFVLRGTIGQQVSAGAQHTGLDTDSNYNALHDGASVSGTMNPYYGYTYNAGNSDANVTVTDDNAAILYVCYDWTSKPNMTGKSFTLTFADSLEGTGEDTSPDLPDTHTATAYGTALANLVPADPVAGNAKHYSFNGWFADKNCTIRAFFKEDEEFRKYKGSKVLVDTMPGADLTIYAGWNENRFVITIDPNYGVLPATGSTWFRLNYGETIQEYTTTTRRFVESDTGTWYYVNHSRDSEGNFNWPDRHTYYTQDPSEATEFTTFEEDPDVYRYAGWYEVKEDGSEEQYNFSQGVDHDTTVRLHWTKTGVFYLEYNPVVTMDGVELKGSLYKDEENEKLYVTLDGDAYNDDADVVVTRTAVPPTGYEFVGWTIRGDDSGTVYRPGETFRLLSSDAATVQGKRRVYLDAVYSRVAMAKIVYHANGGTVTDESQIDYGSPAPEHSYDSAEGTVTVSGLVNNSGIVLSDGSAWLTMEGAVFAGWCSNEVYDPDNQDAPLLLGGVANEYNVDTAEPADLYAVWKTEVHFHLNKDPGDIDSGWDTTLDPADVYTCEAYIGAPVNRPESVPIAKDTSLMFREWRTAQIADGQAQDDSTVYDFSEPVTGELNLWAYWDSTLNIPVRALDASAETITDETENTDWTVTNISLDGVTIQLDDTAAAAYAAAPAGYHFAFAAAHAADDTAVTAGEEITSIRYDTATGEIRVTYADGREAALGSQTVCFVYYQEETLDIHYMDMATDGALSAVSGMSGAAPASAADLGEYNLAAEISEPLSWAGKTSGHYAYAIGSGSASNVSKLSVITDTSDSDSDRPVLRIENTWRGYRYSTDEGASWQEYGYEKPGLYVVYCEKQATVVIFGEETHALAGDIDAEFNYDYSIYDVDLTTQAETLVYGPESEGYHRITLSNGDTYSAILFTEGNTTQKIVVTQEEYPDYVTTVDGTTTREYSFTATDSHIGETQEVTFVNTCSEITVKVHVAQVHVNDGSLLLKDSWITGEDSFALAPGEEKVFSTELPAGQLVTGQNEYDFGTVFSGTDNETVVTPSGDLTVSSIAYEPVEEGGSIYNIYLKDSDGNRLNELGDNKIYYLYYPKPTLWYMLEAEDGSLEKIRGSRNGTESDAITYGGAQLTLNGKTVEQGQKVSVPPEGLTISQQVGSVYFNMPPLLDKGVNLHDLVYCRLGAKAQDDTTCQVTKLSDFSGPEAGYSEYLVLDLKIVDNKLQWKFEDGEWTEISQWPVIYAIYRERGYELDITKTIPIDTGYREPFTITLSSTAINRQRYSVEGTGYTEITADLTGSQGVITFDVLDGSIVKLFGLGPGEYTITETGNANFTLRATLGESNPQDVTVTDNSTITLTLDEPKRLNLYNDSKRICKIDHEYFYTLSSAIQYIEDYSANFTGTIEMLVDYPMPSSDAPEIPSYLNVTLTTASSDRYKTCGDTAVITRSPTFTEGAMITNLGKLTLENVTLDGNGMTTGSALIDNAGTLNIGTGSTMQNAKSTGNGAAVNSWGGAVNVTGGTVTGFEATLGGAIYAEGGNVEISDGSVERNHAKSGGAVYFDNSSGTVTVNGGTLQENTAENNGGAVYMATGHATVNDGAVMDNEAGANGGAIHAENAYVTINGGDITGNRAGENGGAVLMETLTITMNGGNVTDNSADGDGGAFWGGIGSVVISDGTVTDNRAGGNGGAVYTNESDISVSGGTIGSNTAQGNGGGLCSDSGPVTVSGGSITDNTAITGNGGGVYSSSGTGSITGTLTGNTAGANGGAIWIGAGTTDLSGCTISGNTAQNGAAVFADTSTINFSGNNSITGNTANDGGAVGIGSMDAKLNFSGKVEVKDNYMGTGESAKKSNVYLDQDADTIINASTLDAEAEIGVYVAGISPVFENRGVPSARFGSSTDESVAVNFKNDRTSNIKAKAVTESKKLIWIRDFIVEVYYIASYANGFPYDNGTNPTVQANWARTSEGTPPSNENVISEIADDVRSKGRVSPNGTHDSTAIFGNAYRKGSVAQYSDYITNVDWNPDDNRWEFRQADGTDVHGGTTSNDVSTLIMIFTEPYYLSIENNAESTLTVSSLSVTIQGLEHSIISGASTAGYGYIFADNDIVQDKLLPVTAEDLVLQPGESIKILLPGGKNMSYSVTGSFSGTEGTVEYTQTGVQAGSVPVSGFTLNEGTTPNTSGGTSAIVFGGDKAICKVVAKNRIDGVNSSEYVRDAEHLGTTDGEWEYTFKTPQQAMTFILAHPAAFTKDGILTAAIEMLADYMLPGKVSLPTGTSVDYNITFTTAVTGTFQYPGEDAGRRASVSRATGNTTSFIEVESGNTRNVLNVSNIIFDGKNYNGSIDGGIVKTKDWNVEINNAEFNNCIAINGGGIYVNFSIDRSGGNLTVTNTIFNNCKSDSGTSRQGGGAIWTYAKILNVHNCRFTGCTGVDQGGAIFHCIDTTATGGSQLKCMFAPESTTYITNSHFSNCKSRSGGAVESDAHHITFEGCSFTDCYSAYTKKAGSGGAICTYIYEKASYVSWGGDRYATDLTVTGCRFEHCTSSGNNTTTAGCGGAIRSQSDVTTIENSTFNDCRAEFTGGAISANNGVSSGNPATQTSLTIRGCTITDCVSEKIKSGHGGGGAIFCAARNLIIEDYGTGENARHTLIKGCTSIQDGGGIYHKRTGTTDTMLSMTNVTIDNCTVSTGTDGGGGLYTNANTVTLTGCTIQNCTTPKAGGGVYITMSAAGTATLDNTVIQSCTATGNGGGIWTKQDSGTLILTNNSSISRNISSGTNGAGGGIYTNALSVSITGSEINGNQAPGDGGGVCQNGTSSTNLTIDGSSILDNISGGMGGGVYTKGSMTLKGISTIENNRLTGNDATKAAGVYLYNGETLTVGETGSNEKTTVLKIRGNKTVNGDASDLRMPESSGENENCVRVYCGISGEIRVVNANKRLTQFGQTEGGCTNPLGFSDLGYVFVKEDGSLFGIVDRSDATGTHIIWGGDPICKITDGNGRLLYMDTNHARPAVFDQLDDGIPGEANKTCAFGVLRAESIDLYYANGERYNGSVYQVKMLVEDYEAENLITATGGVDRTIILTTAGSKDSLYPYRGRTGSRCTITRAAGQKTNQAMITAKVNLTLTNIVLDGNASEVTAKPDTRLIYADYGSAAAIKITLGRNSTLQNAKVVSGTGISGNSGGNGGGVYLNWGAQLAIEGGAIRNCTAVNGGGVYIDGGAGTMTMTAGTITKCTATKDGGGIYYNKGGSAPTPMSISGGTISRCNAVKGAGIYLTNNTIKLEMSGGTITGNNATSEGGGIAVAGTSPRIYFSQAPYVYGNTCDASVADDKACNVRMDRTFTVTDNNPGTVIVSRGLIRGATIGVYVPGKDNGATGTSTLYDKHGAELDPFATFEGTADSGMNYFINDRNDMKGGKLNEQAADDKKIYWRIIYALSVTKQVLSDEASDLDKEFDFRVTLSGNSASTQMSISTFPADTNASELNGEYGDLYFVSGVANFKLKSGETKTAELLPLGFDYEVEEILSEKDSKRFQTSSINDEGELYGDTAEGHMGTATKFTYEVSFSNLSAVCKIVDPDYGLLYTYNPSTLEYVPEVYANLARAFNKVNAGDSREWYYKLAEGEFERVYPKEYRVEMLVPEYDMDYPESLASLINGKKATLTTADRNADDGFPYVGTGAAKIVRAVTGESMFTVFGDLTLDNIILDGGSNAGFTCEDNGGILRVTESGELTIGTGVTLQNATTEMNGAGIYLAEGSKLYISGEPEFDNNVAPNAELGTDPLNGGTAYTQARQDIYIAGYENENAASLVVTGNLTGNEGSIWVWAEDKPHYWQRKQFAVLKDSSYTGVEVFRNARTDRDTINNTDSWLRGTKKSGDSNVYWSGSPIVTVTKKLVYDGSVGLFEFSFEATLYEADGTTPVSGCMLTENLTTDSNGKVTFVLKTRNSDQDPAELELFVPRDRILKVAEINLPEEVYETTINDVDKTPDPDDPTDPAEQITVAQDTSLAFVNTRINTHYFLLTVTKKVEGAFADRTLPFTFTVSGLEAGTKYDCVYYEQLSEGAAWTEVAGAGDSLTADSDGKASFQIADSQKIVISVSTDPDKEITISEEIGVYSAAYISSLDENGTTQGNSVTIGRTMDATIDFINTLNAVAPTAYSSRRIPYLLMLAAGLVLVILLGGMRIHRKRRKEPDGEEPLYAKKTIIDTGPPGGGSSRDGPQKGTVFPDAGQRISKLIRGHIKGHSYRKTKTGTEDIPGTGQKKKEDSTDGRKMKGVLHPMKKKGIATLAIMLMIALIGSAAFADSAKTDGNVNTYKGIESSENTIGIAKQIVFINAENTAVREPNIIYTYTIAPATPGTAKVTDANGNIGNVRAGIAAAVTGAATSTTSTVIFADTATVSATANGTASAAKYAEFTFDPSKFIVDSALTPGIYRYSITESCNPTNKASVGIAEPANYNAGRFLDVYVKWNDARTALEIYGYVLFEGSATTSIASTDVTMKSTGYVNTSTTAGQQADVDVYETQNLYIHKTTTGALAQKNNDFPITLTLTAPTGVTAPKMDVTVSGNGTLTNTDGYISAWGDVTGTVRDGSEIAIKGIPTGATASVVETNNTVDSYKVKAGSTSGAADLLAEAIVAASNDAGPTSAVTLSAKTDIYFTNTLDTISPTGYVTRFAPYALMLIGGIVLLIIAKKHKKHADEE